MNSRKSQRSKVRGKKAYFYDADAEKVVIRARKEAEEEGIMDGRVYIRGRVDPSRLKPEIREIVARYL